MAATSTARSAYRSERQLAREASILLAAREELTDKGYDGVTMNALAEKAGVVKKTLYNLYGSKDDLLLAAISEIIDSYRGVGGTEEPGIASIVASRNGASRQIVATPAYAEAMTKAITQVNSDHDLIDVLMRDGVSFNLTHLRIAQVNDELIADVDIEDIAEQIAAQGWGITLLCMKGVIPIARFEDKSLRGLLVILLSVTKGHRHQHLAELLETTSSAKRGGRNR